MKKFDFLGLEVFAAAEQIITFDKLCAFWDEFNNSRISRQPSFEPEGVIFNICDLSPVVFYRVVPIYLASP